MGDTRILHYRDTLGRAGKLKGEITFTDGRICRVWDDELHEQCKVLAAERVTPVRYTHRQSAKWGTSLVSISRASEYVDAYDAAQGDDEQRGRLKSNSYLGRKLAKAISR